MTDYGISISNIYNYVIYYGIILLVLIPAVLFGKRIFCHYFCWMAPLMVLGTKISRILHWPGLHITVKQVDNCISCGKCNRECPMGIKVSDLIKEGQIKRAECIQCGGCIYFARSDLLKRGLASKRDGAENNRNKIIYSITEDGRDYLKGWLANPVEKDELRYETLLNLFFGHEAGVEQTLVHIEAFEEKISKELPFFIGATEVLKKNISEDDTHKYYLFTAEFGVKTYQAYLAGCKEAKMMLKEE